MGVKIGILAFQGNVSEHRHAFERALGEMGIHGKVILVKEAALIPKLDGIAIPGGESTTISRLIERNEMRRPLLEFSGGIFATCAGMVLVAADSGDPRVRPLHLMDISVDRNAFGRQRESFEADLELEGLDRPFHAVFIRAPIVKQVGPGVRILARIKQGIVAAEAGNRIALSFHPELGQDTRLHRLFLERIGI